MANTAGINWRRVVGGGLLAGVIIDILEATGSHALLGTRMDQEMRALGRVMQPTASAVVFFVSLGLALGLISVWLYAAMRPRFGPGPKTAIYTALAVWFLYALLPHLLNGFLGLFSLRLELQVSALLLVWHVIATLAGAWVYKESNAGANVSSNA